MIFKRLIHTIRLWTINSPMKRVEYLKRKKVFNNIGNRVMIQSRKIPLYPELIKIHNNVWIASGVKFITHDVTHFMLNGLDKERKYEEKVGCIEVMNNVFIGANSMILYDVKIGNNVIVAAGSVVTKDIPDNSIVGGVPAKVIGDFNEYYLKRKSQSLINGIQNKNYTSDKQKIYWEEFEKRHNKIKKLGV